MYKPYTNEEMMEIKKETRTMTDKFFWNWTMLSGATLVLLFNFINDIGPINFLIREYLRFAILFILISFIFSPLRNFLSNDITARLNLIGSTTHDKDGGVSLVKGAKILSFFRNIFSLLSVVFYIFGLILIALTVNILYLS